MRDAVRWLIVLGIVLVLIGLIAYARGPQHHRRFRNDRAAVIAPVPWRFGGAGDVQ